VVRRGVPVGLTCSERCSVSLRVSVDRRVARRLRLRGTTLGAATVRLARAGSARTSLRLPRATRALLRRGAGSTVRLVARAVDPSGNRRERSARTILRRAARRR